MTQTEGHLAALYYYSDIQLMATDAWDLEAPTPENIKTMLVETEDYSNDMLEGIDVQQVAECVYREMVSISEPGWRQSANRTVAAGNMPLNTSPSRFRKR